LKEAFSVNSVTARHLAYLRPCPTAGLLDTASLITLWNSGIRLFALSDKHDSRISQIYKAFIEKQLKIKKNTIY